jgi:hypothetical protein
MCASVFMMASAFTLAGCRDRDRIPVSIFVEVEGVATRPMCGGVTVRLRDERTDFQERQCPFTKGANFQCSFEVPGEHLAGDVMNFNISSTGEASSTIVDCQIFVKPPIGRMANYDQLRPENGKANVRVTVTPR